MTTCNETNYVSQMPGTVNLQMIDENDMTFSIDWNMDITDYTFEANIIPKDGSAEIPMDIDIINALEGKINITIEASSIEELEPSVHRWYLNWSVDGLIRTVISGALVLRPI